MKLTSLLAVFLVLCAASFAAERVKSIIHVSHIGARTVGITCENGSDPTGNKTGDVLLISCGK